MGIRICIEIGIGGEIFNDFNNFREIEFEKVLMESGKKVKKKVRRRIISQIRLYSD